MTVIAIPVGGISLVTTGATLLDAVGGAAISSGAGVIRDVADDLKLKAINVSNIQTSNAFGFLLQSTTNNQGAKVVPSGVRLTGWSGLTKWQWFAFMTNGGLTDNPAADLTAGDYVTFAGFAISATDIFTQLVFTGETI